MKLARPFILAFAIAFGFFYFTTWRNNSQAAFHPSNWLSHPAKVEITEAAGGEQLDSEEQNSAKDRRGVDRRETFMISSLSKSNVGLLCNAIQRKFEKRKRKI